MNADKSGGILPVNEQGGPHPSHCHTSRQCGLQSPDALQDDSWLVADFLDQNNAFRRTSLVLDGMERKGRMTLQCRWPRRENLNGYPGENLECAEHQSGCFG